MNSALKFLLRIVASLVGAYLLAWAVCLLIQALNLHSLESLCGHNAPIQIFVYWIVIFLAWLGIASAREAKKGSDADHQ